MRFIAIDQRILTRRFLSRRRHRRRETSAHLCAVRLRQWRDVDVARRIVRSMQNLAMVRTTHRRIGTGLGDSPALSLDAAQASVHLVALRQAHFDGVANYLGVLI